MPTDRQPDFKIITVRGQVTFAVTFPANDEGIDILDDISRMLSHRGWQHVAKRIAGVVINHRTGGAVGGTTCPTESEASSKQAVQPAKKASTSNPCFYCNRERDNHDGVRHPYTPTRIGSRESLEEEFVAKASGRPSRRTPKRPTGENSG